MNAQIIKDCINELDSLRRQEQLALQARVQAVYASVPEIKTLREKKAAFLANVSKQKLLGNVDKIITSKEIDDALADFSATEQILLVRASYPSDFLQLKYHCQHCQDTGFIGSPIKKRCNCLTQAILQKAYNASDSNIFKTHCFECFDESIFSDESIENKPSQRATMVALKKRLQLYCNDFPNNEHRLLMLAGQTGLGKTYLLHCMANELIERKHTVVYYSSYSLLDSFFTLQFNDYVAYKTLKDQLSSVDVLILDDLGSETLRNKYTVEDLFFIINTRIQLNKHLFISTNLNMAELKARYTERIISRLFDRSNASIYLLQGDDVRLKSSRPTN